MNIPLFCSGFLLVLRTLGDKAIPQAPVRSYLKLLLRRYYRLTIPALVVLLCTMTLPYFVEGPFEDGFFTTQMGTCPRVWWQFLVHVNNFQDGQHAVGNTRPSIAFGVQGFRLLLHVTRRGWERFSEF